MAQRVEYKIGGEYPFLLAVYFHRADALMQMIDRRAYVRLPVPIGEDEDACPPVPPLAEHSGHPVCERNDPAGILALASPNANEAEPLEWGSGSCTQSLLPLSGSEIERMLMGFLLT